MRRQWQIILPAAVLILVVAWPGQAAPTWLQWYEHEHEVHIGTVLDMGDEYWLVGTNVASLDPPDAGIVVFRVRTDGNLSYPLSYDWDCVQSAADAFVDSTGDIIYVGQTDRYGAEGADMYVLKTDTSGQTLEEWVVGESLEESASRIVLGSHGDYIIIGNQLNPENAVADASTPGYGGLEFHSAPYAARIQTNGQVVWKTSYGSVDNVVVFDAAATFGGGCLMLCTLYGFPNADDAILLYRLDENGTVRWSRLFTDGNSKGYSLLHLDTGRILVAGARSPVDGGNLQALLMLLEATGREIWSHTFGNPEMITALHALVETSDGLFVAAGTQTADYSQYEDDVYLICVNADGELQWDQTISTGKHVMVEALLETSDGGFLIAGTGAADGEPFGAMLMRVDP